ncbi:hypothetical protein [Corynebacterium sp. HS2168-gen11]|uniref:hypothetical protein n=1 Tax=Corynebacterium sp. HS2168-gen11 TaxID=2974027 RepID=UPI00216B076A|nr:hypothetical protein [Corynebacterium sp. HS2168-gen11]MCS4536018.1 hypothetical protein [Corynebacterium sp. HS2168-gen11]
MNLLYTSSTTPLPRFQTIATPQVQLPTSLTNAALQQELHDSMQVLDTVQQRYAHHRDEVQAFVRTLIDVNTDLGMQLGHNTVAGQ